MGDYSNDFVISYDSAREAATIRFRCFDTPNSVTIYGVGESRAEAQTAATRLLLVWERCLDLHRLWSFSLPESDIARLNADVLEARVSASTASLLVAMRAFSDIEPLFDFTIGPVSLAWKHASRIPTDSELAEALSHVGREKLHIVKPDALPEGPVSPDDRIVAIAKDDPKVRVDVGGAAKGYAADEVADLLRAFGVKSADIDLGGNLFMLGSHPEGRPWRVSVRIPAGMEVPKTVLQVVDKSVVTSGSYERFVEIDGKRYQHIVDPLTGWPSESDLVSATVVSESSLRADMLATTCLLAGSSGFEALASRYADCSFVAFTAEGAVLQANLGRP